MKTYSATATREGNWWVIDVDGVGVTQSRSLADAEEWACGLVTAMTGDEHPAVRITVSVDGLGEAKAAQSLLAQAQEQVIAQAAIVRGAVLKMTSVMSHADAAIALGIARQRVTQLAGTSRPRKSASRSLPATRAAGMTTGVSARARSKAVRSSARAVGTAKFTSPSSTGKSSASGSRRRAPG